MGMRTLDKLREIFDKFIVDTTQRGETWKIYGQRILTPEGRRIRNESDAQRTLFYHYNARGYE
jgi:hypothetical protein